MAFIMAGRYYDKNAPRRRRRRTPNLMPLLLLASAVICVAVVVVLVVLLTAGPKDTVDTPIGSQNVSTGVGVTTLPGSPTAPTSSVPTTTSIPSEAVSLMAQTDFIAAGYDYDKAISMLENSEYYAQVPEMQQKVAEYQQAKGQLVRYPTPEKTPHVFFHSLIADTSRAFDGDGDSFGYNMYIQT